jgi:uncharacterized protein YggE
MEKSVQITLIIASAAIILALIGVNYFFQLSPTATVSANGEAQIKATPDLVGIYFNLETSGKTSKEANDKNKEVTDNLITALIKQGFDREEIKTQSFNIYPDYNWQNGKSEIIGYKASHAVKIEFSASQTEKIGIVIDSGVNAGALINYINFELGQDNQNKYKADALKQATEDARIKAEAIASGLGKKLGSIYSVSSSSFNYYPWKMYDMVTSSNAIEAKQAVTSIQPSEKEINAAVSVSFKLR